MKGYKKGSLLEEYFLNPHYKPTPKQQKELDDFFKLIKTMSNNDTLTLFMEKNNENQLGIKIHNDEKNLQTTYKLNLLDIQDEEMPLPSAEFDSELTFPSNDFQKIIRDMSNISENIDNNRIGSFKKAS